MFLHWSWNIIFKLSLIFSVPILYFKDFLFNYIFTLILKYNNRAFLHKWSKCYHRYYPHQNSNQKPFSVIKKNNKKIVRKFIVKYDFKWFHCSTLWYDKHSTYIIHTIKYEHVFSSFLLVWLNILTTRHFGNVMHSKITYVI